MDRKVVKSNFLFCILHKWKTFKTYTYNMYLIMTYQSLTISSSEVRTPAVVKPKYLKLGVLVLVCQAPDKKVGSRANNQYILV